jgi:hypothetical protein
MTLATTNAAARGANVRTGIAGEYFVAAELVKRGWIVGMTAKNAPGVDLLAAQPDSDRNVRIDVKTRTGAYRYAWGPFSGVRPECTHVVLVDLNAIGEAPEYWVLPARDARRLLTKTARSRYGQFRNRDVDEFYDAWELLDS